MVFISKRMFSVLEKLKAINKAQKMLILSMLSFVVVVGTMMVGGIGFSYDVIYNGEKVGRISDLSVYGEAKSIAKSSIVSSKDADSLLAEPRLSFNFSFEAPTTSAAELSTSIISHSGNVIKGYSVRLNGQHKLYVASKDELEKAIQAYCNSFNIEAEDCNSFVKTPLTYVDSFVDAAVLSSNVEIENVLKGLEVTTVANKKTRYSVKYNSVTTRTSKKDTNYKAVTTAGVNGINEKVERITYLNGVQVSSETVSDKVIKEPVTEKVLIGTAKPKSNNVVVHNVSTKGYIWPLAVKGVITSYWGDGRNHKGLDIAAPKGTDIRAVKAGKVVYAGYKGDYGYNVVIDHGNGVQTRYAHSSKLYVKAGQTVKQGQVIAAVGTTGQSTGNHCHFEVIINGTRVNPAPYLGI